MRALTLAVLLVTMSSGTDAARAAPAVTVERVQAMLGAYEAMPSRDEWVRLGPEVVPIVIAISKDADAPTFRRVRALTVLGHFATADALARLATVASADASPSMQRTAVLALAKAAPDAAMPIIAAALGSPDPFLRQTAAKALGSIGTPEAAAQLRGLLARETDAAVRAQARHELRAGHGEAP